MPFRPQVIIGELMKTFGTNTNALPMSREETKTVEKFTRILKDAETDDLLIQSDDEEEVFGGIVDEEDWKPDDDDPSACVVPDKVNFSSGAAIDVAMVHSAVEFMTDVRTKKLRSFASMQRRYRFIKTQHDMQKLRVFAKNNEIQCSRVSQFSTLSGLLRTKVFEAIDDRISIDKFTLRRLAVQLNDEHVHIEGFQASDGWLKKWKKTNGLVSRHVTTFITRANYVNKELTEQAAKKFVEEVKAELATLDPDVVYNCDQSGFTKEQYCKRTLAPKGVKRVERLVQSKDALTHSYTILPMLSASGKLAPMLYVVLQEKGGKFPKKGHFSPDNLIIRANTSHIMNKQLMVDWVESAVCDPSMPTEVVLLLDAWPAWKNEGDVQAAALSGNTVHVRSIPPGATSFIQPCDLYFFCPLKNFVKKVNAYIIYSGITFKTSERDNLLRVISAVYRVFRAPIFQSCWKYGWIQGGYIDDQHVKVETPSKFCFKVSGYCSQKKTRDTMCQDTAFLLCPYCKKVLCFNHWVGCGFPAHKCKC
uniref:Putative transposase n=1 Tax=Caenorhabditis elegans TaxID=6239 RepID=G5ED54_CAEEL|nr:putative transposase [Caenorhabditis elegans]CAA84584.1 putative transposase [Caenorhabditis elegans]